jgi:hypothetical protein
VPPYTDDSLADESSAEERDGNLPGGGEPDALHLHLRRKQTEAEGYILTAARLIAPLLQPGSWSAGFDWCRERLNAASYGTLASEVQLARANEHLARKEYAAAVALLKKFGRSDSRQRAAAAVNLSTLSLLEGQMEAAAGYGDYCCEADPSSPAALVSRGNVHMAAGQAEAALQVRCLCGRLGGAVQRCGLGCSGGALAGGWSRIGHHVVVKQNSVWRCSLLSSSAGPAPTYLHVCPRSCTRTPCSGTEAACRPCSTQASPAATSDCPTERWR